MTGRLDGKIGIVTGGSRGIGRAITEAFLAEGARVLITGTTSATVDLGLEALDCGDACRGLAIDFTVDPTGKAVIAKAVEHFGGLDILVNNAGTGSFQGAFELTAEEWDRVFMANLTAPFFLAREAARVMGEKAGGSITNMSSIAAQTGGLAGSPAYAASKAGLVGLTRSLARRFADLGVRVNAISPADIETDMTAGWSADLRQRLIDLTPLGRFGEAAEVAGAAIFLASDEASFITGQTIGINGGAHME